MLARAELTQRTDFASKDGKGVPEKITALHKRLVDLSDEFQFKRVDKPLEDEEHHTWSIKVVDSQGAERNINWELASSPEFRQMMAKYSLIKEFLEPPFLVEFAPKGAAATAEDEEEEAEAPDSNVGGNVEAKAESKTDAKSKARAARALRDPVEKQTARELFAYIVEQGKKDYQVQRYKGLGEMTATQLWETTMDPERRTLLVVKLEDWAESDAIFTTLMGEDVEQRRKFIENNALDVKNLDI